MAVFNDTFDSIIRKAAVEIGGDFNNVALQMINAGISTRKQLAQLRPSDTNNVSLLSPDADQKLAIGTLIVANTSDTDVTYSIFHDDNGTTYSESTALFWEISIRANSTHALDLFLAMDDSDGNLAVKTSSGNAITFTAYGAIFT